MLRLPLSAVVIATVLTAKSGDGVEPLVIVGSVVALVVTLLLSARQSPRRRRRRRRRPMGDVLLFSLTAMANPTLIAVTTVMLLLPSPKKLMFCYLIGALFTSITLGIVIVFAAKNSGVV